MPDTLDDVGSPKARPAGIWPAWTEAILGGIKQHERPILIAAIAFQIVILLAMTIPRATPLLTGETILLRVVPVDPRDLLRGDYVILSYEISRVPPGGIPGLVESGPLGPSQDATVYVTLVPEPDGQHYRGGPVGLTPPAGSQKYIRGTVRDRFRIEFGIESYFVQEGRGKPYEDAIRNRGLSARIALAPDGQAALRGLVIE